MKTFKAWVNAHGYLTAPALPLCLLSFPRSPVTADPTVRPTTSRFRKVASSEPTFPRNCEGLLDGSRQCGVEEASGYCQTKL